MWKKSRGKIFKFLETAASKIPKLIWFDTTDSTWCTQFEVMPYVNKFLKAQMFVDKEMYLKRFRTGRIYTDFFDKLYNSGENSESYPLPQKEDLNKMDISWNSCFENYNEMRYSLSGKLKNLLRPYLAGIFREKTRINFVSPLTERKTTISCRVGISHSRPSVAEHRNAIMKALEKRGVNKGKIPLPQYFKELRNSQIAVSPFGVGEITLRDYEIIISGAALLKPEMSHLKTWPDLFQADKTFVGHKWDLSDLEDKIQELLEDNDRRINIASNAQKVYRDALSEEGLANFAKRLTKLIEK